MKQALWNFIKLLWMIAALGGYGLYYSGSLDAIQTMALEIGLSLLLTAVYSFLSTYRLGPCADYQKLNPKIDIAEMNPNQWLFIVWIVQSLAVAVPAYSYGLACAIVSVSLLAAGLLVICGIMAHFGRACCKLIAQGLMDY